MIRGSFQIYDIDTEGNKTLVVDSTNDIVPDTWKYPVTGQDGTVDIKLLNDFGKGKSLRLYLNELRLIRSYEKDLENLRIELQKILDLITKTTADKQVKQKELDDLLAEIANLKQEIVNSENLINNGRDIIEQLNKDIPKAKLNVQLKNDDIIRLTKQKELYNNDIRVYTTNVEKLKVSKYNTEVDIDSYISQIKKRSENLKTNADIQSIYSQISNYESTIKTIEVNITDKKKEIVVATTEFNRLRDIWIQKDTDNAPDKDNAKADMDNKRKEINALETQLYGLEDDKQRNKDFIRNLNEQLIAKIIELEPSLKTIETKKKEKEKELADIIKNISDTEAAIEERKQAVTATDSNIITAKDDLETLKNIVTAKEKERSDTIIGLQQAQVIIVSNTNAIPLKESEIPDKEAAVKVFDDKLAEYNKSKTEIDTRIAELEDVKNKRIAEIDINSLANYSVFEFRSSEDEYSYPTLAAWKSQNLTNDELTELAQSELESSEVIGGFPCIIKHTFKSGDEHYGLYYCGLSELFECDLEFKFPTKANVKKVSYISPSGNGTFRNFKGEKYIIDETQEVVYNRIFQTSKMFNTHGSYYHIGVTYNNKLLSLAKIVRDDDHSKSLILNDGHTLEINYFYNFLFLHDYNFEYNVDYRGQPIKIKIAFDETAFRIERDKENYYIGQMDNLAKGLSREYKLIPEETKFTNNGDYVKINVNQYKGVNIVHSKIGNDKLDPYWLDKTEHMLKQLSFNMIFNDSINKIEVKKYMTVEFEPAIAINNCIIDIPLPFVKDLFEVGFLNFEAYRGREFDYYKQSGVAKSISDLDKFLLTDSNVPNNKFPYINNVEKVTSRLW